MSNFLADTARLTTSLKAARHAAFDHKQRDGLLNHNS
jgi:hypothetical protein